MAPYFGVENPAHDRPNGLPHWFADSVAGDDGNDGRSQNTAFATLAAARAVHASGEVIGLVAGSRFHDNWIDTDHTNVTLKKAGAGANPVIDGSRAIASGAWALDSGAMYAAAVTHAFTVTTNGGTLDAESPHFGLWFENAGAAGLTPYWGGATIADNKAWVLANPGTMTCHRTGSTVADPRQDPVNDVNYTYFIHLPAGVDPRVTGVVYYAEDAQIVSGADGLLADGIDFQRTAAKTALGVGNPNSGAMRNCELRDAAVHGWVGAPFAPANVRMTARPESRQRAGGGFHFFNADATNGQLGPQSGVDLTAEDFWHGFYSHGDGGGSEHKSITLNRVTTRRCLVSVTCGNAQDGWFVNDGDLESEQGFATGNGPLTVKRTRWWSPAYDAAVFTGTRQMADLYAGDPVVFEDCAFVWSDTLGGNLRYIWQRRGATNPTVIFRRCTLVNGNFGSISESHAWNGIHLVLEDTILQASNTTKKPWLTLKATNSAFRFGGVTPAALAADPNADISADCLDIIDNPPAFLGDPQAAGHDVSLDPASIHAQRGMGVDNALLP